MNKIALLFLFFPLVLSSQVMPYKLYNKNGKSITFERMSKELMHSDVVLFGEYHDNSIAHWLQIKLVKSLSEKKSIALGLEMFENDNAQEIQQYVEGKISEKSFDTLVRFWPNYKTDYRPMVEFAKENKIPVIATNVPRRYASLLYKKGMDTLLQLPEQEKQYMAPLPFPYDANLPSYKKMLEMFGNEKQPNENFPKAQAIKDATMAYFIVQNIQKNQLFIHINGSYHSDYYEGVYWYIQQYSTGLNVKTISVVEQKDIHKLDEENTKKADYLIVVDEDVVKTH